MRDGRRSWRRILLYASGLALPLVLLAFITLWLMFQRIPRWYQPAHVPAAELQAVRDDLTDAFQRFSDQMRARQPFTFRLRQQQVNAWLAARAEIWPRAAQWTPEMIRDPYIAFEAGRIILAGTAQVGNMQTVVNASLVVTPHEDHLALRITRVRCGVLTVPRHWLAKRINKRSIRKETTVALDDLFAGAAIPNEFDWPNPSESRFCITALTARDGELVLDVQPLPLDESPQPAEPTS